MKETRIFGTKISLTTEYETLESIRHYNYSKSNYICIFGLLELLQSATVKEFQISLNDSFQNPLHSRFIEMYLKIRGNRNIYPIDPLKLLKILLNDNVTHFFYGSTEKTLSKMEEKVRKEFPNARVIGYKSPPFINLEDIKMNKRIQDDIYYINKLKPNIIWIGIGGWKQDILMHYYKNYFDSSILVGVGAVFDIFAGNIKESPSWMKRIGIRWIYYILQQPIYRTIKLLKLSIMLSIVLFNKIVKNKSKVIS